VRPKDPQQLRKRRTRHKHSRRSLVA
jgi:hypothetical protein